MSEPIFTQVERSVAELAQNAINPRTLKDKAFKELQQSLEKDPHFLKARPIIVSMAEGREGTVIAGNQRLAAAKALGWATVPVVEVREATEEQEKEWMVKDNLHKGEWDFEKLATGFDLDFLKEMGFDEKGLNKVLSNVDNSADDEFDAEKEAEAITEPVVQRGEIWQLGEHRLMCGDSTDGGDVALLMDGKKADMVFTDPPYGVDYSGGIQFTKSGVRKEQQSRLENDSSADIYLKSVPMMASFCDGPIYTWFAGSKARQLYEAIDSVGGQIHAMVVWVKNGGYGALNACYKQKHEPCLFWKVSGNLCWVGDTNECTIWEIDKDGKNKLHPTQKPIELCVRALLNHSANTCLDLFLGSGSTLIACENTGRACYGMEIDPKYCDVIIRRWEEKTGKKAVKLSS